MIELLLTLLFIGMIVFFIFGYLEGRKRKKRKKYYITRMTLHKAEERDEIKKKYANKGKRGKHQK